MPYLPKIKKGESVQFLGDLRVRSFVRAGRMKLPIYRTHKNQLIFDGDLRPEGAFVKHKLFENSDVTMGAFVIANSGETENAESIYFYTAQFIQYIEDFRFTLGYHYYDSLQGRKPTILYNTGSVKGVAKGNTLDANGTYAYDYHIAELALQVVGAFNDSDVMGGGTNGHGHQFMGGYQLAKNTQLAFTYMDTIVNQKAENEHFQRLHLDIKFVFKSE